MVTSHQLYNEEIIRRFAVFKENGRVAHAYLFVGPRALGKSETALAVAKLLKCESVIDGVFCDKCSVCVKITHGHHPDVHVITADDTGSIKIDAIRGAIRSLGLKPFEGRVKVFIIQDAENLTPEAANCLLKTLEEPAGNSVLLLTTAFPERSLDTIVSRCQRIQFCPLPVGNLESQLQTERLGQDVSHFLAYYAEGCPGKAQQYRANKLFKRKNTIIDAFIAGHDDTHVTHLADDAQRLRESLCVLLSWFRDIALAQAGIERSRFIHCDRAEDLAAIAGTYSPDDVYRMIGDIIDTSRLLEDNFNMKVALTLLKEQAWRK